MNLNLPKRTIFYKGGFMMVNREDNPKYQCTSCYKPFFCDEVLVTSFLAHIECPRCNSLLRQITDAEPLIIK